MKIGIMTFHWATNYGAILQAYALQEYLSDHGHEVEIINYKPNIYNHSWISYLVKPRKLRHFYSDCIKYKKEKKLSLFRKRHLKMTDLFSTSEELRNAKLQYDVIISGSDQVLNPSFTLNGEGVPTSVYFLEFYKSEAIKIGYAVSFGCVEYPLQAKTLAQPWIQNFDRIGTRENTGRDILCSFNYTKFNTVVPDPTILIGKRLFRDITIERCSTSDYYCLYVLRRHINVPMTNIIRIDDTSKPLNMGQWLGTIIGSNGLITNSYHGMIMAILNHVPFVAIKEKSIASGMNDRFDTLLGYLDLHERLVDDENECVILLNINIDWNAVDIKLNEFRKIGQSFLEF